MNDENATGVSGTDTKFVIIAGSLLLVIIALLAGLWASMRIRAMRAERNAVALRSQLKLATGMGVRFSGAPGSLDAMLNQMTSKAMLRHKVQRESLQTEQVHLNGRDVKALRLPADAAEKFGFTPGDVIIVDEPPPTTTTAPITTNRRRTGRRSPWAGDG